MSRESTPVAWTAYTVQCWWEKNKQKSRMHVTLFEVDVRSSLAGIDFLFVELALSPDYTAPTLRSYARNDKTSRQFEGVTFVVYTIP